MVIMLFIVIILTRNDKKWRPNPASMSVAGADMLLAPHWLYYYDCLVLIINSEEVLVLVFYLFFLQVLFFLFYYFVPPCSPLALSLFPPSSILPVLGSNSDLPVTSPALSPLGLFWPHCTTRTEGLLAPSFSIWHLWLLMSCKCTSCCTTIPTPVSPIVYNNLQNISWIALGISLTITQPWLEATHYTGHTAAYTCFLWIDPFRLLDNPSFWHHKQMRTYFNWKIRLSNIILVWLGSYMVKDFMLAALWGCHANNDKANILLSPLFSMLI